MTIRRFLIPVAVILVPSLAVAYGTRVHELLPTRTLGAAGAALVAALPATTEADLAAFRLTLYARAARLADTSLRRAFLARYPSISSFDARAFKEFLMMNGTARVLGVDYLPAGPVTLGKALEMGSAGPDVDRRNQDRLLRGPDGTPRTTSAGDSIPFDPMSLNMGQLTGLSSQGHAHYGLNAHPKSDDPDVLKREPWNFAIATGFPGPVITYAPDNAQFYTDLSLLAALDGRPQLRLLSALYAGNAMHYIADVGNAVHTIQVGIHPILVDATLQAWIRKATTVFGLFGRAKSRDAVGIDIIKNLHSLSEKLFETELLQALHGQDAGHADSIPRSMRPALTALASGNDSLARVLADTLGALRERGTPDFGRAITAVLAEANCRDGAEVYRITRDIADSRLRVGRIVVDFDTVPDEQVWRFIRVHRGAVVRTGLDDFNELHARGLGRTATALQTWWAQYQEALASPALQRSADGIVARLVAGRLEYLAQAEARRHQWLALHGGPPVP